MPENTAIQHLDNATVLRIISHLTAQLREEMSEQALSVIQSEEEARLAIAALLESSDAYDSAGSSELLANEAVAVVQARVLLQLLWEDETLRPRVEALIVHPPEHTQRSVELALATAIILGGLISWLQTKIEIEIVRKEGKTDFRFHLIKDKTSNKIIGEVVKPISKVVLMK
jgi:hypothetical protein